MKTFVAALFVFACTLTTVQAQADFSVRQLVSKADFIGFVHATANTADPHAEWRQWITVSVVDPVKGALFPTGGAGRHPFIKAHHAGFAGYPTQFADSGQYLVFLQAPGAGSDAPWTTLAAYHVQYYPSGLGTMLSLTQDSAIGLISGSRFSEELPGQSKNTALVSRPTMTVAEARQFLDALVTHKASAADRARIFALFYASLQSKEDSLRMVMPTREERLALAQKLAAAVTLGTTRAEVEKIFPQSDGGAFGSNAWRYYFGSEVMIDVPYDTTGGAFQPENKVNGPLRVYRSMMHYD